MLGRMRSWPPASTAMVPPARLVRCAAASMPRARPEITAKPASLRPCAMRCVILMPAADALREPTTATSGIASASRRGPIFWLRMRRSQSSRCSNYGNTPKM
jgi:hypothetical protein